MLDLEPFPLLLKEGTVQIPFHFLELSPGSPDVVEETHSNALHESLTLPGAKIWWGRKSLSVPVCEMVSITLFLMRSAIVSFDSSHPNYRTVGIWLSWQEVVMRAVESPVLEFRGLRRWHQYCFWLVYWLWSPVPVSIVLLVFLVPLNSYKLITIPSAPFHVLLQHSEFPWVFLWDPWSTILSTLFKNLYVISTKEHKLSRFPAIGMDTLAMNWVKKNNW